MAARVNYKVEREMLRLPTTRNVGIVGRGWMPGFENEGLEGRWKKVIAIASKERADGVLWVERAKGLMSGKDVGH